MSEYHIGVLVFLCFNLIAAYSVWISMACGQLNLGIAGFMCIGAYSAAWLTNEHQWAMLPAFIVGGIAAAIVALFIALPVLRTSGIYLAMATFALGQVVAGFFLSLEAVGSADGYPVAEYLPASVVMIATVVLLLLMIYLSRTRFVLYLGAIRKDATVADLMGLNVRAIRVCAFTGGALIAGLGGSMYGHHYGFVEAQHFSAMLSIYTVLYVLLGGINSVWGPLVGAVFFTLLPELLRASDQWRYALFATFIIIMMAMRPQGIVSGGMLRLKKAKAGEAENV